MSEDVLWGQCSFCSKSYEVPKGREGHEGLCPSCGASLKYPYPSILEDGNALCCCEICENPISFPVHCDGEHIACPHCNEQTALRVVRKKEAPPTVRTVARKNDFQTKITVKPEEHSGTSPARKLEITRIVLSFVIGGFAVTLQTGASINNYVPSLLALEPFTWLLLTTLVCVLVLKHFTDWDFAFAVAAPVAIVIFELGFFANVFGWNRSILSAVTVGLGGWAIARGMEYLLNRHFKVRWQSLALTLGLLVGAYFLNANQFPLLKLTESLFDSDPRQRFQNYEFSLTEGRELTVTFNRRGGGTMLLTSLTSKDSDSLLFKWRRRGNTIFGESIDFEKATSSPKNFRIEVLPKAELYIPLESFFTR